MRKLIPLLFLLITTSTTFAQKVNSFIPTRLENNPTVLNKSAEGDTVFFFDGNYFLFGQDSEDGDDFDFINVDFDEQIPAASDTYDSDWMFFYSTDADDFNPGDLSQDSAFYFAAVSWFADAQGNTIAEMADNWFAMGPITVPNQGAELSWYYKSVGQWIDGYDVYVTTSGMEPYLDVDPGVTPTLYQKEEEYPCTNPNDTIWNRYSASINDWAGERVYVTFHHTSTDKEMICLDNVAVIETNDMNISENFANLIISPNPSNGVFTITSNTPDIQTIEVVNILGEIIDIRSVNGSINETFDLTSLNSGMYFVRSSNGSTESTQRIIIK